VCVLRYIVYGSIIHSPPQKKTENSGGGCREKCGNAAQTSTWPCGMSIFPPFAAISFRFRSFFLFFFSPDFYFLFVFIVRRQKAKGYARPRSFNSTDFVAVRLILLPNFQL